MKIEAAIILFLALSAAAVLKPATAQKQTPLDDGSGEFGLGESVDPEMVFFDYICSAITIAPPPKGSRSVDYDDDGDLDLYVINSPGGDNALHADIDGLAAINNSSLLQLVSTAFLGEAGFWIWRVDWAIRASLVE